MERLQARRLDAADRERFQTMKGSPVTVLQIGEGNFLRGFFDWMIHECRRQGRFAGSVAVAQPRPSGSSKLATLREQDGLYTLVTRGLENGRPVERKETIGVFGDFVDPYAEWERLIAIAESGSLRLVVSNTTEAGLVYAPEELREGEPILSYPGKAAYLLYRRFLRFGGSPDSGLIFLPCELLEGNGDVLKAAVLRYARDWSLPDAFAQWVEEHNRFLNSLVDRIVTGYPADQAEAWFGEWGYRDDMLTTAEPYHFWAIEAEPELERLLPLRASGLNVVWTDDLAPYQLRKVRILNGAHTLMTPLAILHGFDYVREVMEDESFGRFVREAVAEEIMPTLPIGEEELRVYASTVFERFLNPFIRHRLADIAMNSVSKCKARLLPSLAYYAERGLPMPERLSRALAGLLRYCKVTREGDGYVGADLRGRRYEARDDAAALAALASAWEAAGRERLSGADTARRLLALDGVWGADLAAWSGLADAVGNYLDEMGL